MLTSHKTLSKLALNLLSIAPTSAAVERTFSLQARIHTKNRNRLSAEKIRKMLMITCHEIRERSKLFESFDASEFEQETETTLDDLDEDSPQLLNNDCDETEFGLPSVIEEEPVVEGQSVSDNEHSSDSDELTSRT